MTIPNGRSLWKKIRHKIEAGACQIAFWLFPHLPYDWILKFARLLGWLAYYLSFSQRQVALANLKLALGNQLDVSQRKKIAHASFQSFARTTLETLGGSRLLSDGKERHFQFAPGALELLDQLVALKRGLIALTFHYGNWEWLSLSWGMVGYPVTVVAQPIKNPQVDALFTQSRQQAGHRLLHRKHAAAQLYKTLKRAGIIGLLVDLNSSVEEGGAFFNFFGVPALTNQIVGLLALRTGAPIVCSIATPMSDGRYYIEIGPQIPYQIDAPSFDTEMSAITQRWLTHCETVIRRHPQYWMWMYKRWKVRPTDNDPRFPFYSFYDPKIKERLIK